jgi:hypothetical protein
MPTFQAAGWSIYVAAIIILGLLAVAAPQAQNSSKLGTSFQQAAPPAHATVAPVLPYPVYVVPVQQRDERKPKQRCWDDETAKVGGTLSALDRSTIDLKCSQR